MDCSTSNVISYEPLESKTKNVCFPHISYIETPEMPFNTIIESTEYTDEDGEFIYTNGTVRMYTYLEDSRTSRWSPEPNTDYTGLYIDDDYGVVTLQTQTDSATTGDIS